MPVKEGHGHDNRRCCLILSRKQNQNGTCETALVCFAFWGDEPNEGLRTYRFLLGWTVDGCGTQHLWLAKTGWPKRVGTMQGSSSGSSHFPNKWLTCAPKIWISLVPFRNANVLYFLWENQTNPKTSWLISSVKICV